MKSGKVYIIGGICCVLLWGLSFCGMRGSFQRYPLRVSFAYFCNDPFYNKLGVNPVFNIIKSAEYGRVSMPKELAAIDEQEALRYVQQTLHIEPIDSLRPLVRAVTPQGRVQGKPNVVLIFMESMAIENLDRQENGQWLTPYLRELREKSIYWSNCYSTGIHTNNGIVGVHYGFVPNFAKPSMDVNADLYTGLPYYLQKNGYATMCFVTGNPQYDNMNSFWRDNHIEDIYSLYDYPSEQIVNNFGVSDGYMFEWGLKKLEERSKEGKPFFASFLTVSNHGPFIVPSPYVSRAEKPKDQIIAYADDALKQFVEAAKQTECGKNTIFVLAADHGSANLPHTQYDMPLSYNHGITDLKRSDLKTKTNRENRIELLTGYEKEEAGRLMQLIDLIEEQKKELEDKIKLAEKENEKVKIVEQVPGVGKITAYAFVASIGEASRFLNVTQISSFLGFVPKIDCSSTTNRYGHITKRGNAYLRGLLVQGTWTLVNSKNGGYLQEKYRYLVLRGMSKKKAIVAIARKMAELMFTLLKNNSTYERRKFIPPALTAKSLASEALCTVSD